MAARTGRTIPRLGVVRLNSISIRKRILEGSKVGSGLGLFWAFSSQTLMRQTCLRAEKGAWHLVWSDLGVFEQDFDETDMFTEAGILVFDMGG